MNSEFLQPNNPNSLPGLLPEKLFQTPNKGAPSENLLNNHNKQFNIFKLTNYYIIQTWIPLKPSKYRTRFPLIPLHRLVRGRLSTRRI